MKMITSSGYKKYLCIFVGCAALHCGHVISTVHVKWLPKNWLEEMFVMYVMLLQLASIIGYLGS